MQIILQNFVPDNQNWEQRIEVHIVIAMVRQSSIYSLLQFCLLNFIIFLCSPATYCTKNVNFSVLLLMLHFLCDMTHEFCVNVSLCMWSSHYKFVHLNIVTSYLSHSKRNIYLSLYRTARISSKKISIIILQFFFSFFVAAPSTLMSAIKKCICEISQHLYSTYGTYSKKSEKSFFHSKNIKAPVIFFSIHVYVQYLTYTHTGALLKRDHLVDHSVEVEGGTWTDEEEEEWI